MTEPRRVTLPVRGKAPSGSTWKALGLRLYRLGVLAAIAWLVRDHHVRLKIDADAPITREEVREFFPEAIRLEADHSPRGGLFVVDRRGGRVGYVLRTSPVSDRITGYAGPTDTLVALDAEGKVVGIKVRSSADTKSHLADVVADDYFMHTWNGLTFEEVSAMTVESAKIEGVSGASLTSLCIANSIHHRFKVATTQEATPLPPMRIAARDVGLAVVIGCALVLAFTDLRGRTWLRRSFQVGVIAYVGFVNGDLLAQSLLAGWAKDGVAWRMAPGLVLLAATALLVPWATRRPVYCAQICPHGAAQELLGRLLRRKPRIPTSIDRGLRWGPGLLLGFVLLVIMLAVEVDLAGIEPFDAYVVRSAGWATIGVAVVGLVAALFVPMAYCKYGCPTGALLQFGRSHGRADRVGRRDVAAALLLAMVFLMHRHHEAVRQWAVS